jgi:low temperature requirement protein LtrA
MHAPDDSARPSRSGIARLISPWEYRHRRVFANVRFTAGGFQLGVGLVLLSLGRKAETAAERRTCYRWATWFLTMAALQLTGGILDATADRSASR